MPILLASVRTLHSPAAFIPSHAIDETLCQILAVAVNRYANGGYGLAAICRVDFNVADNTSDYYWC